MACLPSEKSRLEERLDNVKIMMPEERPAWQRKKKRDTSQRLAKVVEERKDIGRKNLLLIFK